MEHFDWLHSLIFPYLNFIIFAVVVAFAGRKPLAAMAQTRRQEYEALYEAARAAQIKAEAELASLNGRMQQLDGELAEIKRKALAEADAEAQAIISRGRELAAHLKGEAHRIAEGEVLRAKEALRDEVLAAVQEQVEQKLVRDFTPDQQLAYVRAKTANLNQIIVGA